MKNYHNLMQKRWIKQTNKPCFFSLSQQVSRSGNFAVYWLLLRSSGLCIIFSGRSCPWPVCFGWFGMVYQRAHSGERAPKFELLNASKIHALFYYYWRYRILQTAFFNQITNGMTFKITSKMPSSHIERKINA